MGARELSSSEVRALFPAGTVMHNPVTGEYARVAEHTAERAVGELLAVPGGAVARPHVHPGQEERFSGYGVMGLPFRSGHVLALRRFPVTSVGPGYTSVWWRDPGW